MHQARSLTFFRFGVVSVWGLKNYIFGAMQHLYIRLAVISAEFSPQQL